MWGTPEETDRREGGTQNHWCRWPGRSSDGCEPHWPECSTSLRRLGKPCWLLQLASPMRPGQRWPQGVIKLKVRLLSVGTSPRDRKREPKSQTDTRARSLEAGAKTRQEGPWLHGHPHWNFLFNSPDCGWWELGSRKGERKHILVDKAGHKEGFRSCLMNDLTFKA